VCAVCVCDFGFIHSSPGCCMSKCVYCVAYQQSDTHPCVCVCVRERERRVPCRWYVLCLSHTFRCYYKLLFYFCGSSYEKQNIKEKTAVTVQPATPHKLPLQEYNLPSSLVIDWLTVAPEGETESKRWLANQEIEASERAHTVF